MKATRPKHRKLFTIGVCLAAYAFVFMAVNADVLSRAVTDPVESPVKTVLNDPEALADEEYFNSPQVNRAMSLNDPQPYNAFSTEPDLTNI